MSKQVLNLFRGKFREKNAQCTSEGRNMEKLRKNGIFVFFQNARNRSQKCSNTFSTCFEVTVLVKFLISAPWRFERRKDWKKRKISIFLKCPKLILIVSKHVLNLLWGILFEKEASTPRSVETWKNFEKLERLWTFKTCPKTFPKTLFEHVLIDFFDGEKLCLVHPGDSKKSSKIEKISNLQKCPKLTPRVSKLVLQWFFRSFFLQCTLEGREVEKHQKMEKNSNF